MKMPPNKAKRSNNMKTKVVKIVSKTDMRRIGFEFPDILLKEFKVATNMNNETMTGVIGGWMEAYCNAVKKEKKLSHLVKV